MGSVLGTDGFNLRIAPWGERIILVRGAWASWPAPMVLRWPRQCWYSMCQTFRSVCTIHRRSWFTMLISITLSPRRSFTRLIRILLRMSDGSSESGSPSLCGAFLLRLAAVIPVASTGCPGVYPIVACLLFFCRLVGASDALLDFEVSAAVLIGLEQKHAGRMPPAFFALVPQLIRILFLMRGPFFSPEV